MPFSAYLYAFWQIAGLILGVYNVQVGMNKPVVKAFPIRRHRTLGWLFLIIVIVGIYLGRIITDDLKKQNINFKLSGQPAIGTIIIILLVLGAIFSEVGLRNKDKFSAIIKWHPWLNILAMGLLTAQTFIAVLALFG